jgi:hypothetical protein
MYWIRVDRKVYKKKKKTFFGSNKEIDNAL